MMKGKPDPFAGDGPIPFLEEFQYAERMRCSPLEAYQTPRKVRAYMLLYASVKDAELEEQRRKSQR